MKTIRPWGTYDILKTDPLFQVKCITVNPGHKTSLQSHQHRSEHWIVISGTATVTQGEKVIQLQPQDSIFIKTLEKHRLANNGPLPLVLIEVQTGSYFGEDDITRFEDVYGR
jgi:mannose-6-phosphate isomerase-like protein (cupin superfamily)